MALADLMKAEYDAIHRAGFVLQLDCPDLAMSRHIHFNNVDHATFAKMQALQVQALNTRRATSRRRPCAFICAGATTRDRTTTTRHSPS